MRDHLYRLAEIIAFSFTLYDMIIYFPSCYVVFAAQRNLKVSFVIAWVFLKVELSNGLQQRTKIQVDLPSVVKDKDFAMLQRAHSSCIYI